MIAAGVAYPPSIEGWAPGDSYGTYTTTSPLRPGSVYKVSVYTPQPSPAQLAAAGTDYPTADLVPELEMLLAPSLEGSAPAHAPAGPAGSAPASPPAQPIQFAPYGSRPRLEGYAGLTAAQALTLLDASPYAPVYALAQRLRRGAATPYAYAQAVMRYFSHGYTYDLTPARSALPIVTFLLHTRKGYCQQFAGAMALLLRLGGIPAHVSTGFATGSYDSATHAFQVSDTDAHAWVEAWFPSYGWVTFDPTSAAQLAAGQIPDDTANPLTGDPLRATPAVRAQQASAAGKAARRPAGRRSSRPYLLIALACLLALIVALAAVRARRRRVSADAPALIAELERAFARCGRPLTDGVTLASLERRFSSQPAAAAYIRAIRLARFAPDAPPATAAQRRALRRQLRLGLGALGALRALIALPPSPRRRGAQKRAGAERAPSPGREIH